MSNALRLAIAVTTTITVAAVAIVYYRAGLPIIKLAQTDFQGPFTTVATSLTNVVPTILAIVLFAVWTWVIYGAVQQERNVRRVGR